ncbi:tetratricopeptide repeat protein [Streptomyces rochei]|uniref:tetratricopeptide repeat protein n=1 Tax=Streptomyces rochei TaxID=1928 RepID=UPI0036BD2593
MRGLPPRSGTFAGRTDQLDRLVTTLAPHLEPIDASVAAVVGPPGVGKTELVLQAADRTIRERGWFPGGVLFVDLHGYRPDEAGGPMPPQRALRSFLTALGVAPEHLPDDVQDLTRLYRSALTAYADREHRVLVIVDNAASAEQVTPLLPGDPRVPALVTSRHILSDLANATLHDVGPLAPEGALDLLRAELRRKRGPAYALIDEDPEAAARIADRCGHLPLALHIVAALLADTPERPLSALICELDSADRPLDALERGTRGVRAAFALSYAKLPADQARQFRLLPLSIYDGISAEAAACLMDSSVDQARNLLRALARANLVTTDACGDRWRMHDLLASYAEECRLTESEGDGDGDALSRLADYYHRTAVAAVSHLSSAHGDGDALFEDRAPALAWLDRERDNLVTTVRLAEYAEANAPCVGLAVILSLYLTMRHHRDDLLLVSQTAVDAAERDGNPALRAAAYGIYGSAMRTANLPGEALDALRRAAKLYREVGDLANEAQMLSTVGNALQELDRFDEALEAHAAAQEAHRRSGAREDDPHLMLRYGSTLRAAGRLEEATAVLEPVLASYRAAQDREGQATVLNTLANTWSATESAEEAEAAYKESVALFRELGNGSEESGSLNGLGGLLLQQGRTTEALDVLRRARAAACAAGDAQQESRSLHNIGIVLEAAGRMGEALTTQHTARDIALKDGDPRREAEALTRISNLLRGSGHPEEAVGAAEEALRLFQACGGRYGEGEALNALADALGDLNEIEKELDARRLAADAFEQAGEPRAASTLGLLGLTLCEERRWAEAIEPLQRAVSLNAAWGKEEDSRLLLLPRGIALVKAGRCAEAIEPLTEAAKQLGEYATAGDTEAAVDEGEALLWLGHTYGMLGRAHERETGYARATLCFRALGDRDRKKTALACLQVARAATRTDGWRGWLAWLRLRLLPGAAHGDPARAQSLRLRTVFDRRIIVWVLLEAASLLIVHMLTVPDAPGWARLIFVSLVLLAQAGGKALARWTSRRQ